MALVTNNSVFLHTAKCAGVWIRHVFKVCKIPHIEIGDQHSYFPELLRYNDEDFWKDKFIFCFIRHPLTWYQSRWAFRMKHGWRVQHPLDYNCASNDFQQFVINALRYKPTGWVTWEYCNYIDNVPNGIDFIGRVENLVDDMIKALTLAGESFKESTVRSVPKINDSDLDERRPKYWATYTTELAARVMAVENRVISRFYKDGIVNPNDLCCPRPY